MDDENRELKGQFDEEGCWRSAEEDAEEKSSLNSACQEAHALIFTILKVRVFLIKQIDMFTMTCSERSSKAAQKLDDELTASNASKVGNAKRGKVKSSKAKPSKAKDSKALNTTKKNLCPNVHPQPV